MNLSGFSAVYPGFVETQGKLTANDLTALQLQAARDDQAGQAAFGRTIAMIAGAPGAQPLPGAPGPQGPLPPAPGQPSVAASGPAPVGGAGGPPPVPGSPPTGPGLGVGGAPPGGPNMGGPPGGQSPMTWQTIAQQVARSNPGAKPEVIAAAVSKFLPLMTAQSQQEWRQIQLHLQQERLNMQGDRLRAQEDEWNRRHDDRAAREGRLRDQFESLKSYRAKQLDLQLQRMHDQAMRFDRTMSLKDRQQAFGEWDKVNRERFRLLSAEISARRDLTDADKKIMLQKLDDEFKEEQQLLEEAKTQATSGQQPGVTPGGGPPAAPAPGITPPSTSANTVVGGRFPGAGGQPGAPAAGGRPPQVPPEVIVRKAREAMAAGRFTRDQIVRELTEAGIPIPPDL